MKKLMLILITGNLFLTFSSFYKVTTLGIPVFRTYGVKINVTDLDKAVDFYCVKLGFEMESRTDDIISLKTGQPNKLFLNKVRLLAPSGQWDSRAVLTLQVNHLDSTIRKLKSQGLVVAEDQIRREAVGDAVYLTDPFGNTISIMHQTIVAVPHFTEPRIYNFGFFIPDMSKARSFYCDNFGFVVRSENYLPLDLPLGHTDKAFAYMLHFREGVNPIRFNTTDNERFVIMFQTNDLQQAIINLKEKGVNFQKLQPVESKAGKYISFYDPFGYLSELIEIR